MVPITQNVYRWCPAGHVFSGPPVYVTIHHFLLLPFVSSLKITFLEVKVHR